ncbi:MAG: hypothetical protein JOZ77_05385 [Candidatus Eremiobacteraeota bacterium]|nr:hypothetical protein [Candidatus Eremiobacteraeota bacterium]
MRSLLCGIRSAAFAAFAAACAFGASPAVAGGTVTIQQADGQRDVYNDVAIKIIHDALFLTSADGKGTLVIHRAACSYQGDLLVCFVTSAALVQAGETKPLDFRSGTLYVNSTSVPQPLKLSTEKVAPHSVMLALTTERGTYVGLSGRIDKMVK